jgi:hypothetical protein
MQSAMLAKQYACTSDLLSVQFLYDLNKCFIVNKSIHREAVRDLRVYCFLPLKNKLSLSAVVSLHAI